MVSAKLYHNTKITNWNWKDIPKLFEEERMRAIERYKQAKKK